MQQLSGLPHNPCIPHLLINQISKWVIGDAFPPPPTQSTPATNPRISNFVLHFILCHPCAHPFVASGSFPFRKTWPGAAICTQSAALPGDGPGGARREVLETQGFRDRKGWRPEPATFLKRGNFLTKRVRDQTMQMYGNFEGFGW